MFALARTAAAARRYLHERGFHAVTSLHAERRIAPIREESGLALGELEDELLPDMRPPTEITKTTEVARHHHTPKRVGDKFITYKAITPSIRHWRRPSHPHLWEGRPLPHLTFAKRKTGGRNSTSGHITVRFRGGGHRRRIRMVDFKRMNSDPHDVVRIEYDPGRSGHIALLKRRVMEPEPGLMTSQASEEPRLSYILACDGLKAGGGVRRFRQGVPDN